MAIQRNEQGQYRFKCSKCGANSVARMDKAEAEQDQKKHMTQHEQGGPDEYDEEGGDYGFESRVQRQRERELRFKERSAKYGKEGK